MRLSAFAAILAVVGAPAFADGHASGDPAAGSAAFNRQCVSCHVVVNDAGQTLAGRNARTGPNLFNMDTRGIGSEADFRYSDAILELGAAGEMWTEENFVAYVQDPTAWLRDVLDDRRARGKMAYRVRSADDAADIYAYLATLE